MLKMHDFLHRHSYSTFVYTFTIMLCPDFTINSSHKSRQIHSLIFSGYRLTGYLKCKVTDVSIIRMVQIIDNGTYPATNALFKSYAECFRQCELLRCSNWSQIVVVRLQ